MSAVSPGTARERLHSYFMRGLLPDIVQAWEAYELLRSIGENGKAIDAAPGVGNFFRAVDRVLLNQYILSVARMFDPPQKKYEIRSIPSSLEFLERHTAQLPITERPSMLRRLQQAGMDVEPLAQLDDERTTQAVISFLREQMPTTTGATPLAEALRAIRTRRDKAVAHNEAADRSIFPEVRWSEARELVEFAERYLAAIGFGYLSLALSSHEGSFFLRSDAGRAAHSLRILLVKAGVIQDARISRWLDYRTP
jgi:AbiU2